MTNENHNKVVEGVSERLSETPFQDPSRGRPAHMKVMTEAGWKAGFGVWHRGGAPGLSCLMGTSAPCFPVQVDAAPYYRPRHLLVRNTVSRFERPVGKPHKMFDSCGPGCVPVQ